MIFFFPVRMGMRIWQSIFVACGLACSCREHLRGPKVVGPLNITSSGALEPVMLVRKALHVKVGCISGSDGNRHLPEGLLASGLTGCLGPILCPSLAAWLSSAFPICSSWSFICVFSLAAACFHIPCCSWFGAEERLRGLWGEGLGRTAGIHSMGPSLP